jgi:peptidoglycan hydrolase-like protein with peptidoglycan-binding domain
VSTLIADISKWQGNPDFVGYRNSYGFQGVIHKAGGSNAGRYTDSQYRTNAPRVRAAGLPLGHYWFNGNGDPVTDADYFVGNLAAFVTGDLLVLDIENESYAHWNPTQALAFGNRVFQRTGQKVAMYMSASVTREGGWNAVAAAGHPLWVASYGSNNGQVPSGLPNIGGWADWEGWQYTSLFPGLRIDSSLFKHPLGQLGPVTPGAGGGGGAPAGRNISSQSTSWIQTRLNQLGGYGLVVDGIFGPATTAAVIDWQTKHGLQVDGIVGAQTVASLGAGGGNPASGQIAVDGIWGVNTTKAMQRALHVMADGIIGPITVRALQARIGTTVDGVIGINTRKALQRYVGAAQDGIWGKETATKLQQKLNAGTF